MYTKNNQIVTKVPKICKIFEHFAKEDKQKAINTWKDVCLVLWSKPQ